jgi:hypothetical protein
VDSDIGFVVAVVAVGIGAFVGIGLGVRTFHRFTVRRYAYSYFSVRGLLLAAPIAIGLALAYPLGTEYGTPLLWACIGLAATVFVVAMAMNVRRTSVPVALLGTILQTATCLLIPLGLLLLFSLVSGQRKKRSQA